MKFLRRNPLVLYVLMAVLIVIVVGLVMIFALSSPNGSASNSLSTIDCNYRVDLVAFVDANANGTQDAGEPGVPGVNVSIQLAKTLDDTPQMKTTDSTGSVVISGGGFCPEGETATIHVNPPAGYSATTPLSFGPYHVTEVLDNSMTQAASQPIPAQIYVGLRRN